MTPTVTETGWTSWECPKCGAENEEFMFDYESLPEELECLICNFNSGPVEWSKVLQDDEGIYFDVTMEIG